MSLHECGSDEAQFRRFRSVLLKHRMREAYAIDVAAEFEATTNPRWLSF